MDILAESSLLSSAVIPMVNFDLEKALSLHITSYQQMWAKGIFGLAEI